MSKKSKKAEDIKKTIFNKKMPTTNIPEDLIEKTTASASNKGSFIY